MRWAKKIAVVVLGAVLGLLALRFSPGHAPEGPHEFELIAHCGVHQTYSLEDVGPDTCTADRIHPLTHTYIDNTLESIGAAFTYGATMVEIDVHETADDHMVVFHDWTLECRTDGHGVTHDQTLAYLKALDVGYGYTADGGRTFPLRGKGVALMPTLEEVLDRFPDRQIIINQKSRSERTLQVLAKILTHYPAEQRRRLHYVGARRALARELIPDLGSTFHAGPQIKQCGLAYLRTFGLGPLPSVCEGGELTLPEWGTPLIWGWPNRFLAKAHTAGTRVFVLVDRIDEAERVVDLPVDGLLTDHIEIIGPWLTSRRRI